MFIHFVFINLSEPILHGVGLSAWQKIGLWFSTEVLPLIIIPRHHIGILHISIHPLKNVHFFQHFLHFLIGQTAKTGLPILFNSPNASHKEVELRKIHPYIFIHPHQFKGLTITEVFFLVLHFVNLRRTYIIFNGLF